VTTYLSRADHVASPSFLGAMENWGLVHYMEAYLLYDEDWSPTYRKIYVASVIAHGVAHMVRCVS
jgi:aminopeptidase N